MTSQARFTGFTPQYDMTDAARIQTVRTSTTTRLGDRLRSKTISLMQSSQPEPLSEALKTEIEYILKSS